MEKSGTNSQSGIDASLDSGVLTPKDVNKVLELKLPSHVAGLESNTVTDSCVETSLKRCEDLKGWVTPECLLAIKSDCNIVGNKMKSLSTDDSQHSKWEEFRQMARNDIANEECSQLLRRMELQDSDEDEDKMMEDTISKDEVEIKVTQIEENLGRKKQKRQIQWGPVQRMARPRRFPEDGKIVMQRAGELKEYKNLCRGMKPSLLIASRRNEVIIAKSNCADISLGCNDAMVVSNVDHIRNKDLTSRLEFLDKNPEINLPSDLNIDLNLADFPSLVQSSDLNTSSPLKVEGVSLENSWVDIASKGLKPSTSQSGLDDRCNMEC